MYHAGPELVGLDSTEDGDAQVGDVDRAAADAVDVVTAVAVPGFEEILRQAAGDDGARYRPARSFPRGVSGSRAISARSRKHPPAPASP
jgi:hypothetical protein